MSLRRQFVGRSRMYSQGKAASSRAGWLQNDVLVADDGIHASIAAACYVKTLREQSRSCKTDLDCTFQAQRKDRDHDQLEICGEVAVKQLAGVKSEQLGPCQS